MYAIQKHKDSIYGAENVEAGTGSLGIISQRLILEQIIILEDLNPFICLRDWMSNHSVFLSFALD